MVAKIVAILKAAFVDWDFWVAIVTAGTALLALCQTHYQIKLSNKQHLFDDRVRCFSDVSALYVLFERADITILEASIETLQSAARLDFLALTYDAFFDNVAETLFAAAHNQHVTQYIKTRSNFHRIANELILLFRGKEAEQLKEFILQYNDFLLHLDYCSCYPVLNDNMIDEKHWQQTHIQTKEAYERLYKSYEIVKTNDALNKLQKQISLI